MMIREANIEDIGNIAELYVSNWKATYKGMLPDEYLNHLDISYGIEKWTLFLKQSNNHIFVAYEDLTFLGFGACEPDIDLDKCLYLDSLHVCANARGKGVGTKLIQIIGQYAINSNYDKISICIIKGNNNARELYRKLGAVHYLDFVDDFNGIKSNSEKLLWNDLKCFQEIQGAAI